MVETCRDERVGAAAKALSSALGPLSAAEAGQGSGFASDGWSHWTRIGAKRLSGYRVWRNAAVVGVRQGKARGRGKQGASVTRGKVEER